MGKIDITFTTNAAATSAHTKIVAKENLEIILSFLPVRYYNVMKEAGANFRFNKTHRNGDSRFEYGKLIELNLADFTGFRCSQKGLIIRGTKWGSKQGWAFATILEEAAVHHNATYTKFNQHGTWTEAGRQQIDKKNFSPEAKKLIAASHVFFASPFFFGPNGEKDYSLRREKHNCTRNDHYPRIRQKVEELIAEMVLAREYMIRGNICPPDVAEATLKHCFPIAYPAYRFFETDIQNRSDQIERRKAQKADERRERKFSSGVREGTTDSLICR